jgi:trans-aconitate methyltransferase
MAIDPLAHVDWPNWLRRWDAMQTAYLPFREARFSVMLDVLAELLPERFVAVDLASGPGAISQRLLNRFPQAQCLAVDYDPLLLTLGKAVLGDAAGRLRWVEADLRDPTWLTQLGASSVDAVVSTTALHWLEAPELVRLYQQLASLIRPGGLLLNGDHQRTESSLPIFARAIAAIKEQQRTKTFAQAGSETWRQWWDALAQEPSLTELLAERERRFPRGVDDDQAPILALHQAALRDAGFGEVGVIWRNLDDALLLAVR